MPETGGVDEALEPRKQSKQNHKDEPLAFEQPDGKSL